MGDVVFSTKDQPEEIGDFEFHDKRSVSDKPMIELFVSINKSKSVDTRESIFSPATTNRFRSRIGVDLDEHSRRECARSNS